jgi:hypothetical protein
MHEAADAIAEMDRAYTVMQTSYNRLLATKDQLASVKAKYEEGKGDVPLDLYLESQRRVVDGETEYFLNRSRYVLAAKNVHFVKGTLLDYDGIALAEGPWPDKAYHDAAERDASRSKPRPLNYASSKAPVVSNGPFDQHPAEGASTEPVDAMSTNPFRDDRDDEIRLTPPANDSPTNGPTLELNVEPLPTPGAAATDMPMGAAPRRVSPSSAMPKGTTPLIEAFKSAAPPRPLPTVTNPRESSPNGFNGVVISDGQHAPSGDVAHAFHLGPTPTSGSNTPSVSPATRKLPPAITR